MTSGTVRIMFATTSDGDLVPLDPALLEHIEDLLSLREAAETAEGEGLDSPSPTHQTVLLLPMDDRSMLSGGFFDVLNSFGDRVLPLPPQESFRRYLLGTALRAMVRPCRYHPDRHESQSVKAHVLRRTHPGPLNGERVKAYAASREARTCPPRYRRSG